MPLCFWNNFHDRLPSGLHEIIGNLELETHVQLPTGIIEDQLQLIKIATLTAQFRVCSFKITETLDSSELCA